MMAETCYLAESATSYLSLFDELRDSAPRPTDTAETVAMAAVAAANEQNASAILVLSTSGNSARLISKYRPSVPILTSKLSSVRSMLDLCAQPSSQSLAMSRPPDRCTCTVAAIRSGTRNRVDLLITNGSKMCAKAFLSFTLNY